jgi:hypothetical protein
MANEDRPTHAILTESQRKLLRGDKDDLSEAAVRSAKSRIRERIEQSLLDLRLLFLELDNDDIANIFDTAEETTPVGKDEEVLLHSPASGYLPSALAFFVRASNPEDADVYEQLGAEQPAFAEFFNSVERAVERYLAAEKHLDADVTVNLTLKNVRPAEELRADIEDADEEHNLNDLVTLSLAGVDSETLEEITGQDE